MAGDAVIAAPTETATTRLPDTVALTLLTAWSLVAVVIAVRKGWLQGAGSVRWRLGLYEDQILIACGVLLLATLLAALPAASPAARRLAA